jgi:hypothetical protein
MTARSNNGSNLGLTGGLATAVTRLQLSELPFNNSSLVFAVDGYTELVDATSAGQPFAGFSEECILAKDHPTVPADGDMKVKTRRGVFLAKLVISGVAQDDVAHGRAVYAADDGSFSFTPSGTLIGLVWEMDGSDALVLCATHGHQGTLGLKCNSVKTLEATGSQSLTTGDLGKLILIPNTAALEIGLPAAADCTGKSFIIKKNSADAQIVTINPNSSELIDGASTNTVIDAANDMMEIVSDGTGWHIVAYKVA